MNARPTPASFAATLPSVGLFDAASGARIDSYVNVECAIEAAKRRRRFYGKDSEVRAAGATLFATVGKDEDDFVDPSIAFFRGLPGGRHPSTLFGRVYGKQAEQRK